MATSPGLPLLRTCLSNERIRAGTSITSCPSSARMSEQRMRLAADASAYV